MGKDDEAVAEYRRAIKLGAEGLLPRGRAHRPHHRHLPPQAGAADAARRVREGVAGGQRAATSSGTRSASSTRRPARRTRRSPRSRRRSRKAPWELETQRRLIQLLENSGRDDEALAQYEAVVRAAPGEARFQLELAERYWRRGQEKKALDVARAAAGPVPERRRRAVRDRRPLPAVGQGGPRDRASTSGSPSSSPTIRATSSRSASSTGRRATSARAMATWKRLAASRQGERLRQARRGARRARQHDRGARATTTRRSSSTTRTPSSTRAAPASTRARSATSEALADWEKVLALLGTKPTRPARAPRCAPPHRRS